MESNVRTGGATIQTLVLNRKPVLLMSPRFFPSIPSHSLPVRLYLSFASDSFQVMCPSLSQDIQPFSLLNI